MKQSALAQRFSNLLDKTRKLVLLPQPERLPANKVIESEYRFIQKALSKMDEKDVREIIGISDESKADAIIEHLILSKQCVRDVQRAITKLIELDPGRTDWAISEYMTTVEAFVGFHGKTKDGVNVSEIDEKSRALLETMLGLEGVGLTAEFAKKVRGELYAATLGYAHARLCKQDVKKWNEDDKLRKKYGGNIEDYLSDRIVESNIPFFYSVRRSESGVNQIAGVAAEHMSRDIQGSRMDGLGNTAEKELADVFCINHEEKLIVIGAGTTKVDSGATQAESIVRQVTAAILLTQNNPRYARYSVHPFFLHTGYFCATEHDPQKHNPNRLGLGTQTVKEMRELGMTQPQVEALAKMAFYNLLSEKDAHPTLGKIFSLINPHIIGCNTLMEYRISEHARVARNGSRVSAMSTLTSLTNAVDALLCPGFVKDSNIQKEALIHGTLDCLKNFYINYPLEEGKALPKKELAILTKLGPKVQRLSELLKESNDFGSAVGDSWAISDWLASEGTISRHINRCSQASLSKGRYEWSEEVLASICQRKGIFDIDENYIDKNAKNMFSTVSKGKLSTIIGDAYTYSLSDDSEVIISTQCSNMALIALSEAKEMVQKFSRGEKVNPFEFDGGFTDNNSFVQSLRNARKEAISLNGGHDNVLSTWFDVMASFYQMKNEDLDNPKGNLALRKHAGSFLKACLNSGNPSLAIQATEAIVPDPGSAAPRKKKKMRKA